jgi:RNA polymerase sigma factor (sigma-70 family)
MSDTDLQLLERYTSQHAEDAFAEIVRRHLDLVYSAALRQVRSPQLAEEVAQSAFTDLARQAHQLAPDTVLSAWLYQVARRAAIDVVRREARRQAREQAAKELNAMNTTPTDWTNIEPLLDEAMQALADTDRAAVLLRYFENKSLRAVGQALGTTEEAARKRVSRAVETLRERLVKQGVGVGVSGLVLLISANAVQAAPAGLAVTISTAAALAGTTITTTATATATKAIVMTTLQKTLIATALVAAVGTGFYEAHQASRLQDENQRLQRQQAPLGEQIQQLQRERDEAKRLLASVQAQAAQSKTGSNTGELLRLRGEVGTLRHRVASSEAKANAPANGASKWMSDPHMAEYMHRAAADKIKSLYAPLFQELKLTPEQKEKFGQLYGDQATNFFGKLSALPQGAPDQADPAATTAPAASDLASQVHSLLGDAGFARYKEFSEELPARATLTLLNSQLESNPLNDEQSARLIQIVTAEPRELTLGIIGSPDVAFLGSQADIDNFLQRVADSNERIVQQASGFLTPDQAGAPSTVLSNAVTTRKLQGAALVQRH